MAAYGGSQENSSQRAEIQINANTSLISLRTKTRPEQYKRNTATDLCFQLSYLSYDKQLKSTQDIWKHIFPSIEVQVEEEYWDPLRGRKLSLLLQLSTWNSLSMFEEGSTG